MSEKQKIHLVDYNCKKCNKPFASHSSLCNHNKRFHNKKDIVMTLPDTNANANMTLNSIVADTNKIVTTKYCCKFCKKNFSFRQNKYQHEKICKQKNLSDTQLTNIDAITDLKNKINELENKINNQIIPLNNQTNNGIINKNNGTINNTLLNNNNTVNNNAVTINQIGKEPIVFKTKDIKMIANDGMNGPITCVKRLNFNKNKPQNHSYCTSSLEGDYCTAINHKTQQPEKVPKKEIIDKVFESAYNFIETIATQIKEDDSLKKKLSKKEIKEIDRIVANKNKYFEKKNWKIFFNSVNSMSYNYKDLVLSTWKLLKPLDKNLIDESSDSDSDYDSDEIKEVTNFDDNDSDDSADELTLFDLI